MEDTPLRVDSALRALSSLRGLRGAPEVPPLCRETQSLGQQMLELSCENATVGKNGLTMTLEKQQRCSWARDGPLSASFGGGAIEGPPGTLLYHHSTIVSGAVLWVAPN